MICGSPDTVRRRIAECHHRIGFQEFICHAAIRHICRRSLTEKNIRLFASEVMPAIKMLSDRDYRGFELPRVRGRIGAAAHNTGEEQ